VTFDGNTASAKREKEKKREKRGRKEGKES
jgi:hypothetical protein